jgi:hypothetical protein
LERAALAVRLRLQTTPTVMQAATAQHLVSVTIGRQCLVTEVLLVQAQALLPVVRQVVVRRKGLVVLAQIRRQLALLEVMEPLLRYLVPVVAQVRVE